MKRVAIILLLLQFAYACNEAVEKNSSENSYTIFIQSFKEFSKAQTTFVFQQIKKIYPRVVLKPEINLPANAYYAPRNRYRADSIIHFLSLRTSKTDVTIALTNKDISTTKNNIQDWGIIGLGYQPGNACVVSTFRLSKDSLQQQLLKICLHELGHTQGLPHCNEPTCFMRDAEGGNPTNDEKDFCPKCKAKLLQRGWKL